jgi:hypothetical protein
MGVSDLWLKRIYECMVGIEIAEIRRNADAGKTIFCASLK